MAALSSLKKDELESLARSNDIEVTDEDTRESLIAKLNDKGVTEAPSEDEAQADAEVKDAEVHDVSGRYPGGTPGGASESQQPPSKQNLAGTSDPVLPEYDEVTRLAVTPRPATASNPGAQYDDSKRGLPEDAE